MQHTLGFKGFGEGRSVDPWAKNAVDSTANSRPALSGREPMPPLRGGLRSAVGLGWGAIFLAFLPFLRQQQDFSCQVERLRVCVEISPPPEWAHRASAWASAPF